MLTAEQKSRFEAFGYLVFRELLSHQETDELGREHKDILDEDRQGRPFTGERRHGVLSFAERRPALAQLVEDDRVYGRVEALLGPDFMWIGSDGNLYVGDTQWHSDSRADPIEYAYTRIKVAFYLDPVGADTGCLRIIPGSHLPPLHEELEPLRQMHLRQRDYSGKAASKEEQINTDEGGDTPYGVGASDLPAVPLESQPGDVVFFNQRLWHASFGGKAGRRMFTISYGPDPVTDEQVSLVKMNYASGVEAAQNLQHTPTPGRYYTDTFLNSDRPRIRKLMRTAKRLGFR